MAKSQAQLLLPAMGGQFLTIFNPAKQLIHLQHAMTYKGHVKT